MPRTDLHTDEPNDQKKVSLILLVEDEPLVLLCAKDALEDGGYTVAEATDGTAALAALDDDAPVFAGLVTDIRLGSGPDGWEVARHARETRANLPVVYTTGDSAADWPIHGVPNSVMVHKPYASAQLVTAISTLITAVDTSGSN